eukprot:339661-Ditylum_brightwellii.AAC.1
MSDILGTEEEILAIEEEDMKTARKGELTKDDDDKEEEDEDAEIEEEDDDAEDEGDDDDDNNDDAEKDNDNGPKEDKDDDDAVEDDIMPTFLQLAGSVRHSAILVNGVYRYPPGPQEPPGHNDPTSRVTITLSRHVGSPDQDDIISFLRESNESSCCFYSLNDEAEKRALGQEGDDEKSTLPGLHAYKKLHQSMRRDKKNLKQELKTTVEHMQISLQETESRMQQRMLDIEDRIANEVQNRPGALLNQQVINKESQKNGGSGDINYVTDDEGSIQDSW